MPKTNFRSRRADRLRLKQILDPAERIGSIRTGFISEQDLFFLTGKPIEGFRYVYKSCRTF